MFYITSKLLWVERIIISLVFVQIYVNEDLHYVKGYDVTVTSSDKSDGVKWSSPQHNSVHIEHKLTLPPATLITVTIKA